MKQKLHKKRSRIYERFLVPLQKLKVISTNDLLEFCKSCEVLSWNHNHIAQKQEIAERALRRVKQGTSAVLLQSGLNEKWWSDSLKCYYYLQNVQNLLTDGKSQYELRSGESLKGPIVLFDALIGYLPKLREKQSMSSSIWKKIIMRIFFLVMLYSRSEFGKKKFRSLILKKLEKK